MRPLGISSPRSPEDEATVGTVLDSAVQVHRQLGPGLLERFYRRALCLELEARGVSYEVAHPVRIHYRERVLGVHRLDLLVESRVIVELKSALPRLRSVTPTRNNCGLRAS